MPRLYLLILAITLTRPGFYTIAQRKPPRPHPEQTIRLKSGYQRLGYLFETIMDQTDYKVIYDAALANKSVRIPHELISLDSIPKTVLAPAGLDWLIVDRTMVIRELPQPHRAGQKKIEELDSVTVYYTGYQAFPKDYSTGSFNQPVRRGHAAIPGAGLLAILGSTGSNILGDFRQQPTGELLSDPLTVLIRGVNTLTREISAPLIVVNNFIYEGALQNLDLLDINTITILKDAASAGIWGARSGNGVIVITTRAGRYNSPVEINFSSQLHITEKPRLFRYPWLSSSDYIDLENYLFDKGFYDQELSVQNGGGLSPVVELLELQRESGGSSRQISGSIEGLRGKDIRRDFDKYIYRTALHGQYALQINGGKSNYKYAVAGGINNELRALVGNRNTRATLRTSHSYRISPLLSLEGGGYLTAGLALNNSPGEWQKQAYDYGSEHLLKKLYPYAGLADNRGLPLAITHAYRAGWVDTAGGGLLADWQFRPLEELQLADNRIRRHSLELHGSLNYQPLKWLGAALQYQRQHYQTVNRNHHGTDTYFTRDLINRFTQIRGSFLNYSIPWGAIADEDKNDRSAQTIRLQLTMDKRFLDKHHLNLIAGGEWRDIRDNTQSDRQYGILPTDPGTAVQVDYSALYPQYGTNRSARIPGRSGYFYTHDRHLSFYLNASYSPDLRYRISTGIRKDASNLFGININNRWKPFWWVGTSWVVSREPFYRKKQWPWLELRVSYGTQGNVNNKISPLTIIQYPAATNLFGHAFANIRKPADPSLSWETIGHLNLGLDFESVNHRVGGALDWYNKKSDNVIFNAVLDASTGFSSTKRNSARIRTSGMEANLWVTAIDRAVKWKLRLEFNIMRNTVTAYALDDTQRKGLSGFVQNHVQAIYPLAGRPVYSVYSYPFAGLDPFTGDPLGWLGREVSRDYYSIIYNQSPNKDNLMYHGPALPSYFGTWNNDLSWKRFCLATSICYRLGYFYRKPALNYYELYHYGVTHPDYLKRWRHPGDENITVVPSLPEPGKEDPNRSQFFAGSSVNVTRADNIRLQYIKLSYQSSAARPDKRSGIIQWECFFTILNPGILWKASGSRLDPDYNPDGTYYPLQRCYTIGVLITYKKTAIN